MDPKSDQIIRYLVADNQAPYIRLVGPEPSVGFGNPVYDVDPTTTAYDVQGSYLSCLDPEFNSLRIPDGAATGSPGDDVMILYDRAAGHVTNLFDAHYDATQPLQSRWQASGSSNYYLSSNGLHPRFAGIFPGDDARNCGHRGVNGAVKVVRLDEVQSGVIAHRLTIAVSTPKHSYTFPMTGTDGDCWPGTVVNGLDCDDAPPQGTLIQLDPSINLNDPSLGLNEHEKTIARAMQVYGVNIVDSSGDLKGDANLKLENTVLEGRGQLWNFDGSDATKVVTNSLEKLTLDNFRVIAHGYPCHDNPVCQETSGSGP